MIHLLNCNMDKELQEKREGTRQERMSCGLFSCLNTSYSNGEHILTGSCHGGLLQQPTYASAGFMEVDHGGSSLF